MGRIARARPPGPRTPTRPLGKALRGRLGAIRKGLRPHLKTWGKRLKPLRRSLGPWQQALRPLYFPFTWSFGRLRTVPPAVRIVMLLRRGLPLLSTGKIARVFE